MEFRVQHQFRSNVIKNALKDCFWTAYVQIWVDELPKEKIWMTRRLQESLLKVNPYLVCFFLLYNCTFRRRHEKKMDSSNMDSSNSKDETASKQIFCPEISFWVVFNWPESELAAFEEYISKDVLAAVIDLRSCKAIRERGTIPLLLFP